MRQQWTRSREEHSRELPPFKLSYSIRTGSASKNNIFEEFFQFNHHSFVSHLMKSCWNIIHLSNNIVSIWESVLISSLVWTISTRLTCKETESTTSNHLDSPIFHRLLILISGRRMIENWLYWFDSVTINCKRCLPTPSTTLSPRNRTIEGSSTRVVSQFNLFSARCKSV